MQQNVFLLYCGHSFMSKLCLCLCLYLSIVHAHSHMCEYMCACVCVFMLTSLGIDILSQAVRDSVCNLLSVVPCAVLTALVAAFTAQIRNASLGSQQQLQAAPASFSGLGTDWRRLKTESHKQSPQEGKNQRASDSELYNLKCTGPAPDLGEGKWRLLSYK